MRRRGNLAAGASGIGRVLLFLATVTAVTLGAAGVLPGAARPAARADELTASQDNLRTGWDPGEPGLSPSVVASSSFGRLFATAVSGQVYAQPVVAGSTVIVATENDWVYGLAAASGAIRWSESLGTPWPAAAEGCAGVTPDVGVTSTPVYDPSTGTVYLVSQDVPPGSDDEHPVFYLNALSAQTGAQLPGWPVQIDGAPVNDPARPFNSFTELQRPALLLLGNSVYAAFGSHCDYTPYAGYVAAVSTTTRAVTLWSDEAGVTDNQAGIWQSGGGLMSDGPGRIFFASGNGVSPAPGPGTTVQTALAESVVRLAVGAGGTLSAADFFSPANAPTLDAADQDFGSGGPVGLPFGTTALPDLLVQAGKDGRVFLLNRDSLGGREQAAGGGDADVSMAGPFAGQWGHPAAFADTTTVTSANTATANDFVYYLGRGDSLRFLKFGLDASGTPVLSDVANSSGRFGYSSGSPVVTSDGSDASSAVVWVIYSGGGDGSSGMLEAFPAVPSATCTAGSPCIVSPIWSSPIGTASKFTIPATDGGRVYVGTRDGHVLGFGSPDAAPLTASPVDFGQTPVGGTPAHADVTVTAAATVTVSGITAPSSAPPDPFTAGPPTEGGIQVALPVTLSAGDALTVPVTFTPSGAGGATGSLALATGSANFPQVDVSLTGDGTRNGFYATPRTVGFGSVPDGTRQSLSVTITNGGSGSERVTSTRAPAAPFSAGRLPAAGTVIAAGQSIVVPVSYKPASAGVGRSSLTVRGSTGNVTVGLTGTGISQVSRLTAAPASVSFGSVPLGRQATKVIDVTNTGNLPATVKATEPPAVPFGLPVPVAAGLPLNPGYDLRIPVTFTPASTGRVSGSYRITWTDAAGTHSLRVPLTGTAVAPASGIAVPPPGGGWALNGSAAMAGTTLELTSAARDLAGSAVYPVPEPSSGLAATFTARIGSGSGGDGMTLSLLDAARAGPRALGGRGAELGFGGLRGVAVVLGTRKDAGYPSSNFVGIATGVRRGRLVFAATTTKVPALRRGAHAVGVRVTKGRVVVTVDRKRVLSKAVRLPRSVLVAFTAGTSRRTDRQTVTSAVIRAGGATVPPPGGGWSYNASARMSGSDTVLTGAAARQTGTVIYPTPVKTAGLAVQFDAQLTGGASGGDGLTLALLSPATAATAVGGGGARLGFGGLPGVASALVTARYPRFHGSSNFAGISAGATRTALTFQQHALGIGPLRTGTHTVSVQVTAGDVLIVWIDGEQVLQLAEPGLGTTVLLAFTGATGTSRSRSEAQAVRDVAISAAGRPFRHS